jgi:PQQ-dependent catabolism-associated CXXCW motif protein
MTVWRWAVVATVACCATAAAGEPVVPEPTEYRLGDYLTPVPKTLAGADVLTAEQARAYHDDGLAIFIDVYPRAPKPSELPPETVWRDPVHETIDGAVWLPNVGFGVLSPTASGYFTTALNRLTRGDYGAKLVFLCKKDCWMSWNAAKRAIELGYSNVSWFPDGTDGWLELGETLVQAQPVPH